MRYYLIGEESETIVDLKSAKKLNNHLYELDFSHIEDNKNKLTEKCFIRNMAGKYYLSKNGKSWKKIPSQPIPKSLLNVDKVYKLYRGYKPSGHGAADNAALVTQMPGKIVKILVNEGDEISKGQTLVIMEAMKMENEIKAPKDGTIKKIYINEQQVLDQGVLMLELE